MLLIAPTCPVVTSNIHSWESSVIQGMMWLRLLISTNCHLQKKQNMERFEFIPSGIGLSASAVLPSTVRRTALPPLIMVNLLIWFCVLIYARNIALTFLFRSPPPEAHNTTESLCIDLVKLQAGLRFGLIKEHKHRTSNGSFPGTKLVKKCGPCSQFRQLCCVCCDLKAFKCEIYLQVVIPMAFSSTADWD